MPTLATNQPKANPQPAPKDSSTASTQAQARVVSKQAVEKGKTAKRAKKEKSANISSVQSFMGMWFSQYYKYVTLIVCAIIFIAGYFLVIHSKFSNARNIATEQYKESLSEQVKLQEQLAYLQKLQKEQQVVRTSDIEAIHTILPTDPTTPLLLTSLEDIARSSGVVIGGIDLALLVEEISSSKAVEEEVVRPLPGGVKAIEISLSVSAGPYDSLKTFLSNIEKNLRLMDIIALTYSPVGKDYTVTIRAYYMPSA